MAAPIGNQNAAKSRMFEQALIREIKQRDLKDGEGETLRKIASMMIDAAQGGDLQTAKEVRDTLDGKPKQQTELTGADGGPIQMQPVEQFIIDPHDNKG